MATSFWDQIGPGLLDTGLTVYEQRREADAREKLLRRAQGPLYDQQQQTAAQSLALASGADPTKAAAERFAEQQKLLAPGQEADMQNLMQMLQSKGLLGLSTYSPTPGTAPAPGVATNPFVASLLAAREGAKQKSAFDALNEGEAQVDRMLDRSGKLQTQAQQAQTKNLTALQDAQVSASKPGLKDFLVQGGLAVLQNKDAQNAVWGLLKKVPGLFGF
jgi:hypothetical protein